jgi:hypothetical protein
MSAYTTCVVRPTRCATIVRSLSAQRPDSSRSRRRADRDFWPPDKVLALPYTHEAAAAGGSAEVPTPRRRLGPRPPDVIAPEVVRLAQSGITEVLVYPVAVDGHIETTIERFQAEVMPRVRRELSA